MHPTRFEVVQGDVPMLEPKCEEEEYGVVVDEAKCERSGFMVTILKNCLELSIEESWILID